MAQLMLTTFMKVFCQTKNIITKRGIILSLPILVFQVCRFILPGLKKAEKNGYLSLCF